MTELAPQTGDITLPVPSELSQPFWDGCRLGELRYQRCADCGTANFEPAYVCRYCWSRRLDWLVSAGTGTLTTWSIVHRPPIPAFVVPFAPAVVELDEGYHLLSSLIGIEPEAITPDLRLVVEFHPVNAEITLPYFRPLTG